MNTKRNRVSLFAATVLMITVCTLQVAAKPAHLPIPVQYPTKQELVSVEADLHAAISLRAWDHTWACATGITAKTYQGQLDEKLEYIEDKASKVDGKFFIIEDVSEEEALNTAGVRYMYSNSEIYREMTDVSEKFVLASGDYYAFNKQEKQKTTHKRWVFAVEKKSTLDLDLNYDLNKGKMAIGLVSPDGKIIYQNEPTAKFADDLKMDVDTGLWSVILVNHYDADYELGGSQNIQGTITAK